MIVSRKDRPPQNYYFFKTVEKRYKSWGTLEKCTIPNTRDPNGHGSASTRANVFAEFKGCNRFSKIIMQRLTTELYFSEFVEKVYKNAEKPKYCTVWTE